LRFEDHGPGIPDLEEALQEGFSSAGGLGMGLPGAKRLMDEMELHSTLGAGTTVIIKKWLRHNRNV
jgi:serine/threonine-protein kinase RsbT